MNRTTENKIDLNPIGILHCELKSRDVTPKFYDVSEHKGTIEIYPQFSEGLDGIRNGDTIVVLFWFDRADRHILKDHPRGDTSRPQRGVFSTRSSSRPNPIAISELLVIEVEARNKLIVKGVDAMDKTPVIDIKCCSHKTSAAS